MKELTAFIPGISSLEVGDLVLFKSKKELKKIKIKLPKNILQEICGKTARVTSVLMNNVKDAPYFRVDIGPRNHYFPNEIEGVFVEHSGVVSLPCTSYFFDQLKPGDRVLLKGKEYLNNAYLKEMSRYTWIKPNSRILAFNNDFGGTEVKLLTSPSRIWTKNRGVITTAASGIGVYQSDIARITFISKR